ncbi:hypothetical protein BDP27DRAFT_1244207 [Rhodocollybia butyracea]|uniref:Integrase core domain-containing protein n=1 Tax=Rhodocollybia butyracea TaxID=206335 RepID=A0A9P5TXL2_9AGAR|nr:hypothetical protein BDP27DRAFT_1244207 [Rhodocollybia butyracea]
MTLLRGPNRGSAIWGPSTSSTRIERIWVEVGSQFARAWRAFFLRLERLHGLNCTNPHHLWLIHTLFLPLINDDCEMFMENWNSHPISGKGHHKTPNDMRLLGQLEHGVYSDPYNGIHPEVLQYYGAMEIGDETEARNLAMDRIRQELQPNYHHQPVPVPKHESPFMDQLQEVDLFAKTLEGLEQSNFIPPNYHLRPEEWENDGYEAFEEIPFGKRGNHKLMVPLPADIWLPRAIQWM